MPKYFRNTIAPMVFSTDRRNKTASDTLASKEKTSEKEHGL